MNEPDNDATSERKWLTQWVPGIILWLMIGAFLISTIFNWPSRRAGEMAYQAICAGNLKGIGSGIFLYQNEHDDLPPPNLAALVADGQPMDLLICLRSGTEKSPTTQPADITAHCDYIYAPLPADVGEGRELVMVFELPVNHRQNIVNVLFRDSRVKGIQEMDRFVSLVQELNDYHAGLRRAKP